MPIKKAFSVTAVIVALLVAAAAAKATEVATILVSDLNVRSGPGRKYGVVFRLAQQSQVRILDRKKGWLQIDHNGRRGYILNKRSYVSITSIQEPSGTVQAPVNADRNAAALKELQDEAETLQEKLTDSRQRLDSATENERRIIDEINSAEQSLDQARRQVREARATLEQLDREVAQLEKEYADLEKQIAAGYTYVSKRLTALYKLNWLGRVHLLATADSFFDFINRKDALERILAQDDMVLEKLSRNQNAIESIIEQLKAGRAQQQATELAMTERIERLDAEQKRRAALLKQIRDKKDLALAAVKAIVAAASALDATIENLSPADSPAKKNENRGVGEKNQPFNTYKGLLSWPVKGKIVSFFGPYRDEKTNVVNFQSGINIKAERGEPVCAVSDGYAIFSSWFKGFGNMVIIDHGNHYYTVYAHLEEVFKVKGDRVEKGEVIATLGNSGSMTGPALHFEVRHHGKPVDPLEWINKG